MWIYCQFFAIAVLLEISQFHKFNKDETWKMLAESLRINWLQSMYFSSWNNVWWSVYQAKKMIGVQMSWLLSQLGIELNSTPLILFLLLRLWILRNNISYQSIDKRWVKWGLWIQVLQLLLLKNQSKEKIKVKANHQRNPKGKNKCQKEVYIWLCSSNFQNFRKKIIRKTTKDGFQERKNQQKSVYQSWHQEKFRTSNSQ